MEENMSGCFFLNTVYVASITKKINKTKLAIVVAAAAIYYSGEGVWRDTWAVVGTSDEEQE